MKFEAKCDVCEQEIYPLKDGRIGAGRFNTSLYALVSPRLRGELGGVPDRTEHIGLVAHDLITGQNAEIVNMVTTQYYKQFSDFYRPPVEGQVIDSSRDIEEMFDGGRPKDRIMGVLKLENKKRLFLLGHNGCFNRFVNDIYSIGLDRIDTPEKALEWSFQLNEKTWFNAEGWLNRLEEIFGRVNC